MKITVFQSDKGDCLLLEGDNGGLVLADGGMPGTYEQHVAPYLDELRQAEKKIDVVYVSHIDEDHISGILQMMDDAVAWRIYDYQTTTGGNPNFKEPESLCPPKIEKVWHNAFHEQVDDNTGEIEDMLAATVAILAGGDTQKFIRMAQYHQDVATSIRQAINLSRRLGEKQLDIELNPESKGKLMMLRKSSTKNSTPASIEVGSMKWNIIGPTGADLENLRKEWNKWLKENKKTISKIEDNSRRTERNIGNSLSPEINNIVETASAQSSMLAYNLLEKLDMSAPKVLGKRQKVTVPNLASLMFLVEEKIGNGRIKTVLMTGDGHHEDIINGLELQKKIKKNAPLHVDVLKVQHHGSEHNLDLKFCQRIIADHYIFCGNGAHENPDLDVVKAVLDSRVSNRHKGNHPKVNNSFKVWFNSSSDNKETVQKNINHMKEIENLVEEYATQNQGKIDYFFLKNSSFEIVL